MADFRIRDVTDADVPAIQSIYAHAVETGTASFEIAPPDAAEMARRVAAVKAAGHPYRVCVDAGGAVVGYTYVQAYRPRPAYRWTVEDAVYVDPNATRRGIGRMLLADMIERCTEAGYRRMMAVIGDNLAPSIALHRALGFEVCGVLPALGYKHGRWLDTTIMQRPLGAGATAPPG